MFFTFTVTNLLSLFVFFQNWFQCWRCPVKCWGCP